MRQKGILTTIILSLILLIFPTYNKEINAQQDIPEAQNVMQFATKEELMTNFDTKYYDDEKGDNSAKVYFGLNEDGKSQEWWIAGSQDTDSIVLFAASPLKKSHIFNPGFGQENTNQEDWNDCVYINIENPFIVYNTHYGASSIRDKLQSIVTDKDYFSESEQSLFQTTIVYTNDDKNNNVVYSTEDEIYLAYGSQVSHTHVYVGLNDPNNLKTGLVVDNNYWNTDTKGFWTRSPSEGGHVFTGIFKKNENEEIYRQLLGVVPCDHHSSIQPATKLDISNVLFGSTALPATQQENDRNTGSAFTLRYESKNLGSALVLIDKQNVELTGVPEGTYLVAQNSEGVYKQKITDQNTISAEKLGIDTFDNCQVWLETSDLSQRMTYATMAEQELPYSVDIRLNENDKSLNLTSDNNHQVIGQGRQIQPITFQASRGYSIIDDYINKLNHCFTGLGISASRTGNSFTISGTPTKNIDITLPSATRNKAKKPDESKVKVEITASRITVTLEKINALYGDPLYRLNEGEWQTSGEFKNLSANKEYKVSIKYAETEDFAESDVTKLTVRTAPPQYTVSIPRSINLNQSKIAEIKLADESKLDLGYKGKVSVEIVNDNSIENECLILNREYSTETICSQISVNDGDFTNHVIDLDSSNDIGKITLNDPRNISQKIFAGKYTGNITFQITYKEEQINE